jgi:hypothetical protein
VGCAVLHAARTSRVLRPRRPMGEQAVQAHDEGRRRPEVARGASGVAAYAFIFPLSRCVTKKHEQQQQEEVAEPLSRGRSDALLVWMDPGDAPIPVLRWGSLDPRGGGDHAQGSPCRQSRAAPDRPCAARRRSACLTAYLATRSSARHPRLQGATTTQSRGASHSTLTTGRIRRRPAPPQRWPG